MVNTSAFVPVGCGLTVSIFLLVVVVNDSFDILHISLFNYIDFIDDIFLVDVADTRVLLIDNIFGFLPVDQIFFVYDWSILGFSVASIVLIQQPWLIISFAYVDIRICVIILPLLIYLVRMGGVLAFVVLCLLIYTS